MCHTEDCVFIESILRGVPRASRMQRRNGLRSAVTIGVFANQGGLRA